MHAAGHEDVLRAGEIEVHRRDGLVRVGGRVVPMSLRELRLLAALMESADRVIPREVLYRLAWDAELRDGDRSVDVYVHKLRHKLEDAMPGWAFIHTHFGFGYRFAPERVLPRRRNGTDR